jgi:glutamate N-acetyltransferase/amino-acid N-acetyltransferase
VFCDIKRLGTGKGSEKDHKRDLALIVSEVPATAAGMFTTNQTCAAPVKICLERVGRGRAQAIAANSGNANACTGTQGFKDALEMARFTEQSLALPAGLALVGSTGRIGLPLPMDHVRSGIIEAAVELGNTPGHADRAMEAIMTSDTRPKQAAVEFRLGGQAARLGGICKGAGMIQPGMSLTGKRPPGAPLHATMLCFITTDAAIEARALRAALEQAVASSFNRISVDGDMSTNDAVLVLANGLSSPKFEVRGPRSREFGVFQEALSYLCLELAKMIVRDGEGVSRFVTVRVKGAKSFAEADAAARAVANSALVKTSWHGGDPNWGRIIAALGSSPAAIIEEKVDIGYSAPGSRQVLWGLKRGQPTRTSFQELCAAVAPREFDLHIHLNVGRAEALFYAADLTEAYVEFNKGDVSDPASLGG